MRKAPHLIALAALFACGCAFAHAAGNGKVDWQNACSAKCQDPTEILVYAPDGTATVHRMALYSLSPPVGCLCPPPPKK